MRRRPSVVRSHKSATENFARGDLALPIDLLPILLAVVAVQSWVVTFVLITLVPWGRKKKRGIVAANCALTLACCGIYVFRYHRAELLYSSAAAAGDSEAQYRLGSAIARSSGWITDDPSKAETLMKAAASQGHVGAQMKLASWYASACTDAGMSKALPWFKKAAEQGHPEGVELVRLAEGSGFSPCDPSGRAWAIIYRWAYVE